MGSDYYTQDMYELSCTNRNTGEHVEQYAEAGVRQSCYAMFDSDLQTFGDYIDGLRKGYPKHRLFEGGIWYCTESGKLKLQTILSELPPDLDVTAIYKAVHVWAG